MSANTEDTPAIPSITIDLDQSTPETTAKNGEARDSDVKTEINSNQEIQEGSVDASTSKSHTQPDENIPETNLLGGTVVADSGEVYEPGAKIALDPNPSNQTLSVNTGSKLRPVPARANSTALTQQDGLKITRQGVCARS
jgi:hypothetical protein